MYELLYSDTEIIVVNKAPDLACHPLAGGAKLNVLELVAEAFPEVRSAFPDDREGGLCHRIDNGTSGIVVIARRQEARKELRELFANGRIDKSYLAIVQGRVSGPFEVNLPIAHHKKNARKMVAMTSATTKHRSHPRESRTQGDIIFATDHASLVRVTIGAGRRHQIRVHLASMGNPIWGDVMYGGPKAKHLRGHALHAATITLPNGTTLEAHYPKEWDDELSPYR